ncbi:MAG: hypothetical protein OCD01_15820 [Fibrobacterales bacterium]
MWIVIFEGEYLGFSTFQYDPSTDDYSISPDISKNLYESPLKDYLPKTKNIFNLQIKDIEKVGFSITFKPSSSECIIKHTIQSVSKNIRTIIKDPKSHQKPQSSLTDKNFDATTDITTEPKYFSPPINMLRKSLAEALHKINLLELKNQMIEKKQGLLQSSIHNQTATSDDRLQFNILKKLEQLEKKQENLSTSFQSSSFKAASPIIESQKDTAQPKQTNNTTVKKKKFIQDGEEFKTKMTRDEMFQKAFGKVFAKAPDNFQAELIIDNEQQNMVLTVDLKNQTLENKQLINALTSIITPDSLKYMQSLVKPGPISIKLLKSLHFSVETNFETFTCYIGIPSGWRSYKANLIKKNSQLAEQLQTPHPFSGYINARGRKRFKKTDLKDATECDSNCVESLILENNLVSKPLSVNFDGALNLFSFVTEANASYYQGGSQQPFSITNIRTIKDVTDFDIRIIAGEISGGSGGTLQGISLSQKNQLSGHKNAHKISETEFEINTDSEVKIKIIGKQDIIIQLPAGRHFIADLPNTQQENSIKLEITDYAGSKQTLTYDFLGQSNTLSTNKTQWNVALGYPAARNILKQSFNNDSLGASGSLTASPLNWLNLKLASTQKIYGENISSLYLSLKLFKTTYTFSVNESYSSNVLGWSTGGGLSKPMIITSSAIGGKPVQSLLTWKLSTLFNSKNYNQSHYDTYNLEMMRTTSSLQLSLPQATSLGFETGYTIVRDSVGITHNSANTYVFKFSLNKSWDALSSNFYASYTGSKTEGNDLILGANANYNFSVGNHTFNLSDQLSQEKVYPVSNDITSINNTQNRASTKKWNNQGSVGWSYSNYTPGSINFGAGADATLTETANDVGMNGSLNSQWGDITTNYRVIDQQNEFVNAIQHEAAIGARFGIAWAGTSVALTRPINGSFAIIRGKENMLFRPIRINPMGTYTEQATAYPLFPGMLPNISDYNRTTLILDPSLPIGSKPVQTMYILQSEYKSGFEIPIGTSNTAILLGSLTIETGSPIKRRIFQIFNIDESNTPIENEKPLTSFTSQFGRFQAPGISRGRYLISVAIDKLTYSIIINIDTDKLGLIEVGDLKLKVGKPEETKLSEKP